MRIFKLSIAVLAVVALTFGCAAQNNRKIIADQPGYGIVSVEETAPVMAKIAKIKEVILFDFDSYKLDAEAESIVEKVAALVKANPDTDLVLKGHTDKYGADDYNMNLSLNRANAVKESLIDEGVPADSIVEIEGFGKTQLIPNLSNRENRRVLILSVDEK